MTFWEWLTSDKGAVLVAGVVGSAVSATMNWEGPVQAARALFVGAACAWFLHPIAIPMVSWVLGGFNAPTENAVGTSGFLMGMVGIVVVEIIIKAFKLRRDAMTGTNLPATPEE